MQNWLLDRRFLEIDALSAPLLVLVALLHFLTALATGRTKMARFSFAWMLGGESLRLAIFGCKTPSILIHLLIAGAALTYLELVRRGKPTRVYLVHMALFAACLIGGWWCIRPTAPIEAATLGSILLFAAVLIRTGAFPFHTWVTTLFEHASFGTALLVAVPISGAYLAIRLVVPVAPDWVLKAISIASLATACYGAGLAIVQSEARRFFAFLFLSQTSLILVGMELHTPISLTGALFLWVSAAVSLGGLGLTLRALEARFGRLGLTRFFGLYQQTPALAVCFLLTGLATVGFPGTIGFVGTELLVDGAIGASPAVGVVMVLVSALNGIAIVRVYFLLFTGTRQLSSVSLASTPEERIVGLTLAALILAGGLAPQDGVASRYEAAKSVLKYRALRRAAGPRNPTAFSPETPARAPTSLS
jgi:NADH-quinone oxidoreductase subunit M